MFEIKFWTFSEIELFQYDDLKQLESAFSPKPRQEMDYALTHHPVILRCEPCKKGGQLHVEDIAVA